MKLKGIILSTEGDFADVKINAEACKKCPGNIFCGKGVKIVRAKNKIGAKKGDEVIIYEPENIAIFISALLFLFPVFAFLAGFLLMRILKFKEIFQFLTGFSFLGIYMFFITRFSEKVKGKFNPEIVEIIS